jgi:hypothetical protein
MQLSTSTALDVAAYITNTLRDSSHGTTRPRLHRLTYLTMGAHYVTWGNHAFADAAIALPTGPGFWSIEGSCILDHNDENHVLGIEGGSATDVPPELAETINMVIAYFAPLDQPDLDSYTTQPGSPWDVTVHAADCTTSTPPIPDALIQVWFLGHPLELSPSDTEQLIDLSTNPTQVPPRKPLLPPVTIPGHYPKHT